MRPFLLFGAAAIALMAACGEPSSTVLIAPSMTSTAVPTPPAPTERPQVTSSTIVAPTIVVEGPCHDPYLNGSPYEPASGTPIQLFPYGTPEPLQPYQFELPQPDTVLERVVQDSLGDLDEHFSVLVKNLDDGTGMVLNPDRDFYAASLYKTWVMLEAFAQHEDNVLEWSERYVVSQYYEAFGLNPGELQECDVVTLWDIMRLMLGRSDNVAANILLERVGASNINRSLRNLGLDLSGFYVAGTLPTTAREAALLLESIYERAAVSEAASDQMLDLLKMESVDNRIPALLPPETEVAHKTGSWVDATHDVGIVFSPNATYVIVALTDFGYTDDGATPIAELSLAVYDYYNET